jgi:hypothetical protein
MKPRNRWKDNIKMDLGEVQCEGVNWTPVENGPMADTCERGNETLGSIRSGKFLNQLSNY